MKPITFIIAVLFVISVSFSEAAGPAGPGWRRIPSITPDELLPTASRPKSGEPVVAEYITPEISALASGLQNDPLRIYNYVKNHIRYVHYFGSKKGAHVTMLERSGNDFDQAALLVALLRAADQNNPAVTYTVQYEFAAIRVPYQYGALGVNLQDWLGLTMPYFEGINDYDMYDLCNELYFQRGFPNLEPTTAPSYVLWELFDNFIFQHVLVKLSTGGNTYYLDPSLKASTYTPGIDISSAAQLNVNNLLGAAASGATINQNYVQNLNFAKLKANLSTNTGRLIAALNTEPYKNRTVEQVAGGFVVTPVEIGSLPTSYPGDYTVYDGEVVYFDEFFDFRTVNMPKQTWDNIPAAYLSKMRLSVDGLTATYNLPELRGRKVSLRFSTSGSKPARIYLDESQSQAAGSGSGTHATITTEILHPFGRWNYGVSPQTIIDSTRFDQSDNGLTYQRAAHGYVIVYGFDDPAERLVKRQEMLSMLLRQPTPDNTALVTETLEILGLSWVQQCQLSLRALGSQKGILTFMHHQSGRVAHESVPQLGYYVDLPLNFSADIWHAGWPYDPADPSEPFFDVSSYVLSALEHGVLEQWQDNPSASTIRCFAVGNSNGKKIIRATAANWATVRPLMEAEPIGARFTPAKLDQFEDMVLDPVDPKILLITSNTNNPVGSKWKGYGYVQRSEGHIGMIISGGYSGGYGGNQVPLDPIYVGTQVNSAPTIFIPSPPAVQPVYSYDPVNLANGAFTLETTDLVTGQAEPRGFAFARHYSSARRYLEEPEAKMGNGWTHNYVIKAAERSDPLAALGKNTPQEMASTLVGIRAAFDIFTRTPDATYPESALWTVAALATEWTVNQISNNAVNITMGSRSIQFIKQATNATLFTYVPPAGVTLELSKPTNYKLQQRHGNTYNFNSSERISTIVDPYNKTMTFTYLGNGRLDVITDAFNRKLDFEYDATTLRLKWIDDEEGTTVHRRVQYGYNTTSNLISVTDVENKVWTFEYDTDNKILRTKDPMSPQRIIVENVYDTWGRVIEQNSHGDTAKKWRQYYGGFTSFEKDPQGGLKTYFFDEKFRSVGMADALGNRSRTFYDGQDHVIRAITPKGEITDYTYDVSHNLTSVTEAVGVAGQERTSYRYYEDAARHLTRVRDFRGQDTSYAYNTKHQVISITGPLVNGMLANVVEFGYFAADVANGRAGNMEWQEDQRDNRTYFRYNADGEMVRRTLPDDGEPTTTDYELFVPNYRGDVTSQTDFLGRVSTAVFNKRRQITQRTLPGSVVTSYEYDNAGNLWKTTDPRGNITEHLYSATGKIVLKRLPALTGGVIPELEYHYDTRDWLDWAENPLNERRTYLYDAAGRLTGERDALNRTITYAYDQNGRRTGITTPLNSTPAQTTTYGFNARGEHAFTLDAMNPPNSIGYAYDANGNRLTVINREGEHFVSTYYGDNRLGSLTTPNQRTTGFNYEQRGMPLTVVEPSGNQLTHFYDARAQLSSKSIWDGSANAWHNYLYDANGNMIFKQELGTDSQWFWRFYDELGRMTNYSYSYPGQMTYILSYAYDKSGNLTKLWYPDGKFVTYAYDSHNRLTTITDWAGRITSYTYDVAGRVTELLRPNGTKRKISYNTAGEISLIEELVTANNTYVNYSKFTYDTGGRLQDEFTAPIPAPYNEPVQATTYNVDNEIETFNGQAVTYDLDGNMTSGPLLGSTPVTYTYDGRNRLVALGNTTYQYDPDGNRIGVNVGGQVTRYVVNPNARFSQTLSRVRPDGSMTYYVYGPGLLYEVDLSSAGVETSAPKHYHYDYRGSTIAVTANAAQILERIEYSSYGSITRRSGTTVDTPFLFHGAVGVMTDANGLYCMRARYFNPHLRRFVSADPLGLASSLNFYAFAEGNPVTRLDPNGEVVETVWDVANVGMGVYSLQDNVRKGKWGWAALDAVGLLYDGVATAVPFLPAGASAAFKAARAGNTVLHSVNAGLDVAKVSDKVHDAARAIDTSGSSVPWQAAIDGSKLHREVASEVSDSMRYFDTTYMTGANRSSGIQPDMIGSGIWADITTPGQWQKHVNHYTPGFGEGIPIMYQRGVGVVGTTHLHTGAGIGINAVQGATDGGGAFTAIGGWLGGK